MGFSLRKGGFLFLYAGDGGPVFRSGWPPAYPMLSMPISSRTSE